MNMNILNHLMNINMKNKTRTLNEPRLDTRKVKVIYPDNGGFDIIAVYQVKANFLRKGENPQWVNAVIDLLTIQGSFTTRFGTKYELYETEE
jgi:hypothetical protein